MWIADVNIHFSSSHSSHSSHSSSSVEPEAEASSLLLWSLHCFGCLNQNTWTRPLLPPLLHLRSLIWTHAFCLCVPCGADHLTAPSSDCPDSHHRLISFWTSLNFIEQNSKNAHVQTDVTKLLWWIWRCSTCSSSTVWMFQLTAVRFQLIRT